ncbi:response regulator [Candidatus Kaiserbacteria bacterium]|nr:response regulator [Candidatus Kaiserbacteria bacterium]
MSKKILLAEDEPDVRDVVVELLEAEGYEVVAVGNGFELLDRLAVERFDLVVTDNDMPRMSGLAALEQIREDEVLRDLPVIVYTTPRGELVWEHVAMLNGVLVEKGSHGNLLEIVATLLLSK